MKIHALSDLHIEFDRFHLPETDADVVVLAGDIHVGEKGVPWAIDSVLNKPVLYVLGNHEFFGKAYPKLVTTLKDKAAGSHVRILEKDAVTIDGVNFFGCTLWTDFELLGDPRIAGYQCQQLMTDFRRIRVSPRYSKLRSVDVAAIHRQSLQWLRSALEGARGQTNVVVTHHAPSVLSLPDSRPDDVVSAAYASRLEYLFDEFDIAYWLHGHLHNSSDYRLGRTRVICNPRGYPDERNLDFVPDLTVSL